MFDKIKKLVKRVILDNKGSAIIETAIAIPVILGLFMGLLFYANAMRYKVVMDMAAKEGARYYQVTKNSSKAINKAYEELCLGKIDGADIRIIPNGVQINKPYGFYIPMFGRHLLNLKSEHEFFKELDYRYYQQGW